MRRMAGTIALMMAAPAAAADYVVIELKTDVNAGIDAAWKKVGAFCDIEKWAKLDCVLASGAGGVGSIRRLRGGAIEEPMVAATRYSYTYAQTVGPNKGIDYHGTLAFEPVGANRSQARYTLVYDQALLPPDRRAAMKAGLQRFQQFLDTIKAMAEANSR